MFNTKDNYSSEYYNDTDNQNNKPKDLFLLSLPYLDFDNDIIFGGQRFNEIKELAKTDSKVQSCLYNPTAFNFFSTHPLIALDAYVALKIKAYLYNKGIHYVDEELVSTGFIKEITQALSEYQRGIGVLRVQINTPQGEVNHLLFNLQRTVINCTLQNKMQQMAFLELRDNVFSDYTKPWTLNKPQESLSQLLKGIGSVTTDYIQTEKLKMYLKEQYYKDFIAPTEVNFHDRLALMEMGWEAMNLQAPVQ